MMTLLRSFLIFLLCLFAIPQSGLTAVQEIVAVVNEDAISARDLEKRLQLVIASSGLPADMDTRRRLLPQILNGLINETLMLQEATRSGIDISEQEIDKGFAQIAQQNKLSADQFSAMLRKGGVDASTLRNQVRAHVAWSKFVQAKLRNRIIVSERDIDDALERLQSKIGSTEYLTAEIFLPYEDAKSEKDSLRLAKKLSSEIKSKRGNFFKLAQQFSKAAGSAQGGDNGWLNEAQMEPEILQSVKTLALKQTTSPVKTPHGYHILLLREKRTVSENTLPSRDQVGYTLGSQRLEKLQQRHLQDIKAASFVDIRV